MTHLKFQVVDVLAITQEFVKISREQYPIISTAFGVELHFDRRHVLTSSSVVFFQLSRRVVRQLSVERNARSVEPRRSVIGHLLFLIYLTHIECREDRFFYI